MSQAYVIKFPNVSVADSNVYARELRNYILDSVPDAQLEIQRSDPDNMDFGGTLVLVLGAPALVALAKGIQAWLAARRASIRLELPNGTVVAENLNSQDALDLAELLLNKASQG